MYTYIYTYIYITYTQIYIYIYTFTDGLKLQNKPWCNATIFLIGFVFSNSLESSNSNVLDWGWGCMMIYVCLIQRGWMLRSIIRKQTNVSDHIYVSWLVVWNMFYLSKYIENSTPNWRTHIFQRGRWLNHQPGEGYHDGGPQKDGWCFFFPHESWTISYNHKS